MKWTRKSASAGFSIFELMISIGLLGIIVSLSIPAYERYLRRSKIAEATDSLRRISDGVFAYVRVAQRSERGEELPRTFPQSQKQTPASGTQRMHPGCRYPVNLAAWNLDTWAALAFEMNQPAYFDYGYVATNDRTQVNPQDSLTIYAQGDLGCSGETALYVRVVRVDESGSPYGAEVGTISED